MGTPLLLDQLAAQHRAEMLVDACWQRAARRPSTGTATPARTRALLSRLATRARASAAPQACCA